MTATEPERAFDERPTKTARQVLEAPELPLHRRFCPMGFPVELRTNSSEVLEEAGKMWQGSAQRFDTGAIHVDVHLVGGDSPECPPEPRYRIMQPLLVCFADADNYSIADLSQGRTSVAITQAALRHPLYLLREARTRMCRITVPEMRGEKPSGAA